MSRRTETRTRATLDLVRSARLALDAVGSATTDVGLTADQWLTLELLVRHHETGLSMSDLRLATGLTGATLSRTVDKLVTDALAHREVDAHDRRRIVLHASATGKELYKRSVDAVDAAEATMAGFNQG